jgi:tetratricopeptide (TPR) repeat protein
MRAARFRANATARVGMSPQRTARITFLALAYCLITPNVAAQEICQDPVGRFASIEGSVQIEDREGRARTAKLDSPLCEGDTIQVKERSRAAVQLINNAVLRIDQNTTIRLLDITSGTREQSWIELVNGAIESFNHKPWLLKVTTPHLKGDIDGTEFYVHVTDKRSLLLVLQGRVQVSNDFGSLVVTTGQAATAGIGKAPQRRTMVHPRDAVQWSLHYPPVLYLRPEDFSPGTSWQGGVRQSIELYLKGDLRGAFERIAIVPETVRAPEFFTYRASLLLAVGRVGKARTDIDRALSFAPNDGNALALQSVIAVVQNDKVKALRVANRAVAVAPSSATAFIALSYAQQARFDLEGARTSLKKALQLDPQNALAWARLAELWSSFGLLDRALDAARKAVGLQPNLSRTQTVLGFAHLTQVEITQAKEAFDKAISLDQGDPLPRLGLGLVKIREGRLHDGSRDIEVAAGLDPNNALVRSYLGKSYFEAKRIPLDEREYDIAKQLDPRDPTPWFYDAIAKQTTNRPVAALHDLERSIELNSDRAVYRSRLLLDSDLAARSASIGRIYGDLGFEQLALVEGWKSVNTDPTDFSAHRLLADTYAVLPRHEIARVSEQLQSQLLQPLNMTPIQPRLAESNLFLISAQGPRGLSFNEFNPLFNRNRVAFLASALAGGNGTLGAESVVSGIHQKTSFSMGVTHFETDGFRVNNDQNDDILNAFVQHELHAKLRKMPGREGRLQAGEWPSAF